MREQAESRKVMMRMISSSIDLVGELTGELHDRNCKRSGLIHDVSSRNLGSTPNKLPEAGGATIRRLLHAGCGDGFLSLRARKQRVFGRL